MNDQTFTNAELAERELGDAGRHLAALMDRSDPHPQAERLTQAATVVMDARGQLASVRELLAGCELPWEWDLSVEQRVQVAAVLDGISALLHQLPDRLGTVALFGPGDAIALDKLHRHLYAAAHLLLV